MTLRDLIESLHRIYLDPRVSPTTEVCVELEGEQFEGIDSSDIVDKAIMTPVKQCEPVMALAIGTGDNGERALILSALQRSDALAR